MRLWICRLVCAFALGLAAGGVFKTCVLCSLAKKDCKSPGWLWGLWPVNGLLYMWVMTASGWQAKGLLCCLCASALLAVAIIDGKTMEIPWQYNLFIGGLGFIRMFLCQSGWYNHFIGFFAVSSLLWAAFLLTKGDGIGGGDMKLMAAAGLFLGWERVLPAFAAGGLAGAVFHILAAEKGQKRRAFAIGPYLAAGIFAAMF